jgi:arylsulfatase
MKTNRYLMLVASLVFIFVNALNAQEAQVDRTELPIKAPWYPAIQTLDARDAQAPPIFRVEAPKDAPNVVIIMIDDLGFAGTSAFGGVLQTPNFDKLAETGLMYNHFHTTALCSPTRQALKTGRNHHSCNQAKITEVATSFPGATGQLPNDIAPLAKILQMNGYSTGAFGKWHETAVWEISPSGPMDRWPNQQGFDKFYGFMGGETNQWSPCLFDNANPIDAPEYEGYHFMNDMTTQSINWMRFQQSLTPDKPFFIYFTPGAVHAPHHVPASYIEKHKGEFDEGWDVLRERAFEQQKKLGVIPPDTKLAPKPDDIKDWDKLTEKERKLFARQAEVFAAFLDMTDVEIGRLLQSIEDLGEMDNTLIFYIAGDNGTSAEGVMNGLYNEMTYFNAEPKGSDVDFMLDYYDEWGSPSTYPHMAAGWAVAFDAPFTWTKQVASNYGGTRNGLVVHWPNGITAKGELRTQWHHVIDVAPTVLEACGLPEPRIVNGVPQRPIEGTSMLYSFNNKNAPDRHKVQYFEMFGNRGIYFDGWFAGTLHLVPWGNVENSFTEDTWELYHVEEDFSMSTDLADKYPDVLEELQGIFLSEAVKYKVLPLDDRRQELFDPNQAGRPDLMFGRKSLTLYEGMGSLLENDFINVKNTSLEIVAEIETKESKTNGVIVQQGGRFGGWSLYVKDNKPVYAYNYLGLSTYSVSGTALPDGKSTVKLDFDHDGGKPGAGGTATLYVNGKKAGSSRIEKTEFAIFSADETANVGKDKETMVVDDYTLASSRFNGRIDKVIITLKD